MTPTIVYTESRQDHLEILDYLMARGWSRGGTRDPKLDLKNLRGGLDRHIYPRIYWELVGHAFPVGTKDNANRYGFYTE